MAGAFVCRASRFYGAALEERARRMVSWSPMLQAFWGSLRRRWGTLTVVAGIGVVGVLLLWLQVRSGNPSRRPTELSAFFRFANHCAEMPADRLTEFTGTFEANRKVLERDPDAFNSWYTAGLMKKFVCDYEGARDIWEHAGQLRPKNSISFGALGNLYGFFLNDKVKAEANYLKAIENEEAFKELQRENKAPAYTVNIQYYRDLHETYRAQGTDRGADAIGVLQRGLRVEPKSSDLMVLLASYYRDSGNLPEAIRWFEESLTITPNNEPVIKEIARLRAALR